MKFIKKETTKEGIILTCEESYLFGLIKLKVKFIASKEYPKGYWDWATYPDRKLVGFNTSVQLDRYCEDFK